MLRSPIILFGLMLSLIQGRLFAVYADDSSPIVWMQTTGQAPPISLEDLEWDGKTFMGKGAQGKSHLFPSDRIDHLWFPPSEEQNLGHRTSITLQLREPVRIPYRSLPDAVEIRFRIPSEPGLYLLPLVDKEGAPLRNTFQLWIGEQTVTARGKGFGRNEVTAMDPWTRNIPKAENGEVLVHILIDRKEEICHLRLNHVLVQTWKIPTSYMAKTKGPFFLELRSGIDPQRIQDLYLSSWPSGRPGDVRLRPRKGLDRIWLRNGDLLPGKALRIEEKSVWVRLEDGLILPIPFPRIREIHFAR